MRTTELQDVEQALQLIEHVLTRSGEEGEHLVPARDFGGNEDKSLAQRRLASRKTLLAATHLLTVAHRLMDEPAERPGKELALRMKASIEKLKVAARGAYEAGHLLVGVRTNSRS